MRKFFHENFHGKINGAKIAASHGFAQAGAGGVATLPKILIETDAKVLTSLAGQ